MTRPFCPINLPCLDANDIKPVRLSHSWDSEHFEQGEIIRGYYQCPQCGLWWPCVEEPDCWEEEPDGFKRATGWWGAAVCEECGLLMADQPDGQTECYRL